MGTTSIKEVARRAGVSVGTVSNVLNRPELVSPATRDRVLAVIQETGFVRNESARALRAGRSRTIGLVVLDVANPFFTDVARGAEELADANGIMVMLCNSDENPERELRHLEMLEQQRVLGVLITPASQDNPRLDELARRGTAVVLVDREAGRRDRCSVAVDDVHGGRLAVEHLIDQGHSRIAFVGGPMSIQQVTDRCAGAEEALHEAGVRTRLTVLETPSLSVAAGRQAAARLLSIRADRRPTAVFCANDLLALGVLQELTLRSVAVPEDVAIVGYDDIEFAAAAAVPLSSVRQPRELLGRTAVELLLDEISGQDGHSHRQVLFKPELVVRASSEVGRDSPEPTEKRQVS